VSDNTKLTKQELAEQLGVSRSSFSPIEGLLFPSFSSYSQTILYCSLETFHSTARFYKQIATNESSDYEVPSARQCIILHL
jgi:transcriptional regulator with XRE-family HTH domain